MSDPVFIDGDTKWPKVAKHNYATVYYLGASHNLCNILRRLCFQIRVFFHNFRVNDRNKLVKLFNKNQQQTVKVIRETLEICLQVKLGENIVF